MDESKRREYIQRGLPHRHKDGTPCQCRECSEAMRMGLGDVVMPIVWSESAMLFADPDWHPRE